MNRKSFLNKTVAALLAGIPFLSIMSCSGSDDDDDYNDTNPDSDPGYEDTSGDCGAYGADSSIADNHGHTLTVSADDVNAGTEKTYSIQGGATHNHSVTVTADLFASLQKNESVTATSSTGDGHMHGVTITCAS